LKKEGEFVKKDEPLYELSTDKVDTEIPSPISGTLQKIVVQAGQKVPIHTVVALVDEGGKGSPAVSSGDTTTSMTRAKTEKLPSPVAPAPKEEKPAPAPVAAPGDGDRVFA